MLHSHLQKYTLGTFTIIVFLVVDSAKRGKGFSVVALDSLIPGFVEFLRTTLFESLLISSQ